MDISFFTRQAYGQTSRVEVDAPALGMESEPPLTFGQVAERSRRYANALLELGVRPGDRVGILMYNSNEYWLAYFAITRVGAIAVRLNFRLGPTELQYALDDSGSTVLLADGDLLERLSEVRTDLPVQHFVAFEGTRPGPAWALSWDLLEAGSDAEPPAALPGPDDGAMIMYTSGTTGRPKGALWSHGTTAWWTAMQIMEWRFSAASVTMVTGPLYHVGALENYTLPTLAAGGRVVMLRSKNFQIERTMRIASEARVTDLLLFPVMIQQMVQSMEVPMLDLTSVRRIFTGGDAVHPWAIEQLRDRYPWMDLIQVYGLTEGTPIVACGAPGFAFERPQFVGRAFPFAELTIRDDDGRQVPDGTSGEIWTRSPANALGYWNKPQESAETFVDGWCKTGDLGVVEDGALRISGRKKDMIRSGGENIYPAELEDTLLRHPKIADVAVIGIPDPTFVEAVCAVVVVADGEELTGADVMAHCVANLASFKRPKRVEFVDALPRTASLKIQKFALRERFGRDPVD
jgi:fatty-acyl-CoA synthase